jgi:hypothetical protein
MLFASSSSAPAISTSPFASSSGAKAISTCTQAGCFGAQAISTSLYAGKSSTPTINTSPYVSWTSVQDNGTHPYARSSSVPAISISPFAQLASVPLDVAPVPEPIYFELTSFCHSKEYSQPQKHQTHPVKFLVIFDPLPITSILQLVLVHIFSRYLPSQF